MTKVRSDVEGKKVQATQDNPLGQSDLSLTLAERATTHGNYSEMSETAFDLHQIITDNLVGDPFTKQEAIAVFQICLKLARITHGKTHHPDHWRDIAGYANCVLDSQKEF